jgi:hypothetical protein
MARSPFISIHKAALFFSSEAIADDDENELDELIICNK